MNKYDKGDSVTGIDRIRQIFQENTTGLRCMTHAVGGWPDMETSEAILCAMIDAGADILEIQLPFSDPAADGSMIVAANHQALANGATTKKILAMIGRVRRHADTRAGGGVTSILVMSYLNPVLAYGEHAFVQDASEVGVDGFIIPDCPPDEKDMLPEISSAAGLAFVPLIAPDTDDARMEMICRRFISPLVYAVLRYGVTGRKSVIDAGTKKYLERIQRVTGRALAAGFGIRERDQVEALQGVVDCFVAGSVFISTVTDAIASGKSPAEAVQKHIVALQGQDQNG